VKQKKPRKHHKRKRMVPYWQAVALIILLYTTFALCGYQIFKIINPPHFKANKTNSHFVTEVECVKHWEGTYCCEKSQGKYKNLSKPDSPWVQSSDCEKFKILNE